MNYIYILKCKDNTLYTGWTNDLEKRFKAHNEGKGAKYTRGRGPLELMYYEEFIDKKEAMKREYEIKKMKREEKINLIEERNKIKFLIK
ncbi:MAG: GIY-YIG nuclease family protein [Clostridium sp.]|uniref:GIY-YIG nuclease family protein n=1 Tax=Clostridium sp. TaxID=1506 RepID=UPI003EE50018